MTNTPLLFVVLMARLQNYRYDCRNLKDANLDPTVIVGSLLKDKDGNRTNFIGGNSQYFIVEACEYRRSFLNINPNLLVITNIDEDHLDYYKDIEDIKSAFAVWF